MDGFKKTEVEVYYIVYYRISICFFWLNKITDMNAMFYFIYISNLCMYACTYILYTAIFTRLEAVKLEVFVKRRASLLVA